MIRVMVSYTVKADRVAENEQLVQAVYTGLHELGHPDIHYATFRKDDGQTFVHVAFFPDEDAQAALGSLPAFQEFQRNIADRCEVPPKPEALTTIGAYNFTHTL